MDFLENILHPPVFAVFKADTSGNSQSLRQIDEITRSHTSLILVLLRAPSYLNP